MLLWSVVHQTVPPSQERIGGIDGAVEDMGQFTAAAFAVGCEVTVAAGRFGEMVVKRETPPVGVVTQGIELIQQEMAGAQ